MRLDHQYRSGESSGTQATLVRTAATYLVGTAASSVLSLLAVMVFTRSLRSEQYGSYVIGLSVAGVFTALFFQPIRVAYARYQSEAVRDFRATALLGFGIAAAACGLFWPISLLALSETSAALGCAVLSLGIGCFELTQETMRASAKARAVVLAGVLRATLALLLGVAAIQLGGGGTALLWTASAAFLIVAAVFFLPAWGRLSERARMRDLKSFLLLGLPLTAAGTLFTLCGTLDRFAVAHFLGIGAAGEYGAAADLTRQLLMVPAMSLASAIVPLAIRIYANGDLLATGEQLRHSAELLLTFTLPAAAGLILTAPAVAVVFLGPDFQRAATMIIPVASLGVLLAIVTQGYLHISFTLTKRAFPIIAHAVSVIATLVLTLGAFLPMLGIVGAAAAVAAAEFVGACVCLLMSRRYFALPIPLSSLGRIALATCIMSATVVTVKSMSDLSASGLFRMVVSGAMAYSVCAILLNLCGAQGIMKHWYGRMAGRA